MSCRRRKRAGRTVLGKMVEFLRKRVSSCRISSRAHEQNRRFPAGESQDPSSAPESDLLRRVLLAGATASRRSQADHLARSLHPSAGCVCRSQPSSPHETSTRTSHRCHRPPALSSDLEDSARGHSVRRTRPRGQRRGEEGADAQDDPRTENARLSRRTTRGSIEQPGMIGRFSTLVDPRSRVNGLLLRGSPGFAR